jgi:hypothetical protein
MIVVECSQSKFRVATAGWTTHNMQYQPCCAGRHSAVNLNAGKRAMSSISNDAAQPSENPDAETAAAHPPIPIDQRRLALNDFTKTAVKLSASDVHLQAASRCP